MGEAGIGLGDFELIGGNPDWLAVGTRDNYRRPSLLCMANARLEPFGPAINTRSGPSITWLRALSPQSLLHPPASSARGTECHP